ncbi:flavin mononucleotide-binding protein [Hyunsoonleella flava]|uniref:Flavin mononucleotide-binding protein n=1 Tax=Hyunsoonleella flava TaxID=2527939 RepID=A0A4Q9FF94_9FLAO|nr:pyridoxamine 5'-phosphate oxidase family protein [Hyunsoonleella flava]TBN04310.1 flavin mononucleotide-binding protein [Hyunsoonleella flava]
MKGLEKYEIIYLLKNNYIGQLSFFWKNKPYVLPITYYYSEADNCVISYSGEGHKIDAMRLNNAVSIGVTEVRSVNNWKSVLMHGEFEELDGAFAKQQLHKFINGVKKIIFFKEGIYPDLISDFSSKTTTKGLPIVYRIKIREITGKSRNY